MSILLMLMSGGDPLITVVNQAVDSSTTAPTSAVASYRLENDGDIGGTEGSNTINDIGDWISPKVGMANYDAMLTNNSGAPPTGSLLATWLNLGTTRTWSVTQPGVPGTANSSNTLQIRHSASGTVLKTVTIDFQADVV